jgi:hypothetical protein
MRWEIKPQKQKKEITILPKPQLGDTKEKIKFAYTIKRIGNTKILWEKYIEVYIYKKCTKYHSEYLGPGSPRPIGSGKVYEVNLWKLKELKLLDEKPTIINAGYQPTDKLNNTNPPTRY